MVKHEILPHAHIGCKFWRRHVSSGSVIYTNLCHTRNGYCELALALQVDRFKKLNTDLEKRQWRGEVYFLQVRLSCWLTIKGNNLQDFSNCPLDTGLLNNWFHSLIYRSRHVGGIGTVKGRVDRPKKLSLVKALLSLPRRRLWGGMKNELP